MAHSAHGHPGGAAPIFLLFVVVPLVVLAVYVLAARRKRRTGVWSAWRMASFTAGTALVAAAALPPVSSWAHEDLRGHMLQHLLLGMFGPLGIALGAPGTLLLHSMPAAAARRVVAVLRTPVVRGWSHPVTALMLDIGGMYALYLTPLYALSTTSPIVHALVHAHFVLAGYLFVWSIAGPDPAPHRAGMRVRLGVLFVATAAHAALAKLMYAYGFPAGTAHGTEALRAAAQWMYYGGDLAELLLTAAFMSAWLNSAEAPALLVAARRRSRASA